MAESYELKDMPEDEQPAAAPTPPPQQAEPSQEQPDQKDQAQQPAPATMAESIQQVLERDRYCKCCHVNLRGRAAGECPKCGRKFDPYDNRTFYDEQPQLLTPGWRTGFWFRLALYLLLTFGGYLLILAVGMTSTVGLVLTVPMSMLWLMAGGYAGTHVPRDGYLDNVLWQMLAGALATLPGGVLLAIWWQHPIVIAMALPLGLIGGLLHRRMTM